MNASMNIIDNSIINVAILNSKILGDNIIEAYIPFVSTLIEICNFSPACCKAFAAINVWAIPVGQAVTAKTSG